MADKKKEERKNKRGGCVSGGAIRPPQDKKRPEPIDGVVLKRKRPPLDRDRPLP